MRIVHAILSLDPAFGGSPMVVSRLASAQASLGHDVGVIAYSAESARERTSSALNTVPGWDKVTLHDVGPLKGVEGVLAPRVAQRIRSMRDLDIVHLHGAWSSSTLAGARAARRLGVAYVVCAHGMLDPWCLAQSALKKKIALGVAYRRVFNRAAFMHVLNRDERDLMAPLGLRMPTEIIPNGVFLEEFASLPPAGTFRASRPELGDAPYVLFLSRLHHKKGLDYLADAFAIVADSNERAHLVVAGPNGGARADFERRVEPIRERVHVVGPLYGEDKLAALADAACFCLPSRQEGFSIAVTEALACGLPAVVSEACHFPEVAESGAGEVVALEGAAIGAALIRVLSDADLRTSMGAAGKALVRERFNWPAIARRSIERYEAHAVRQGNAP
jgi:glycosyltransferase involved in cell wall biosynthesis